MSNRVALSLGAFLAAVAVTLGAYAAHGLENMLLAQGYEADLAKRLQWFETGVRYHLYHALGILCAVLIAELVGASRWLRTTPLLFLAGILLFSGSLYAMALGPASLRWLGAVVPLGGLAMITGWLCAAFGALTWKKSIN